MKHLSRETVVREAPGTVREALGTKREALATVREAFATVRGSKTREPQCTRRLGRSALVARIRASLAGGLASALLLASGTPEAFANPAPTVSKSNARAASDTVALAPAGTKRFAIAEAPYTFVFPRDHGAHPEYQSEWWYYTGHVRTSDGRRFGYELTFFRVGLEPGDPQPGPTQSRWRGNELYPAHFALTDEAGKAFYHVDRFAREAIGMGAAKTGDLDVRSDDWTLRGTRVGKADLELMTMHARQTTPNGTNAIDFVQMPEKVPAIHGHDGVSRKSACVSCASHYYSYTRLHTTGTLTFAGKKFAIDGLSWMDHEFGSKELQRDQAGWDWFAIQLDDKREVMLYLLRQKDGSVTPQSSGSLVEPDGTVRYLARTDFVIEKTATWKSPHTGGLYPSAWRVRIAKAHLDLTLAPTVADQELAGTSTGVSYWEGAVDIRDASAQKLLGVGYVEMTGYAGAISI